MPLPALRQLARRVPDAEPPRAELRDQLRSGRQPYRVVVHGTRVLFGGELLAAARELGMCDIEVVEHSGCDGLVEADLQLRAAGLHLRAAHERRPLSPCEELRRGARLYREWARVRVRRPPRKYDPAQRRAWEDQREALVREELGHSSRTLHRYAHVGDLTPALVPHAVSGRLPAAYIERAAALPCDDQVLLAAALATRSFAKVRDEYFGSAGRRKTARSAARAVRAAVRTIATEARGRAEHLGLPAELRPLAEEVVDHLTRWLARPAPQGTLDERIAAMGAKLRGGIDPRATRGGRSARGEGA